MPPAGPDIFFHLHLTGAATAQRLPLFALDLAAFGSGVETFNATSPGVHYQETRERSRDGNVRIRIATPPHGPRVAFFEQGHDIVNDKTCTAGSTSRYELAMARSLIRMGMSEFAPNGVSRARAHLVTHGERVDGRRTDHYHFKVDRDPHRSVEGDVWIDVVTKRAVKSTGQEITTTPGHPAHQTGTWTFSLTRLGRDVHVASPATCAAMLQELARARALPQPPGAQLQDFTATGGSFDTTATPAAAVDFYRKHLPEHGWTFEHQIHSSASSTTLFFHQGSVHLFVDIDHDAHGHTSVDLLMP